jgi:hypothetical protein
MSQTQLIYMNNKNRVTDSEGISYFNRKLRPPHKPGVFNPSLNEDSSYSALHDIMAYQTIKRGCCRMGPEDDKIPVDVQMPLPSNVKPNEDLPAGRVYKKYNIHDIPVTITKKMCEKAKEYKRGSGSCNNFYVVYCKNMMKEYLRANNGNFDYEEFRFASKQW